MSIKPITSAYSPITATLSSESAAKVADEQPADREVQSSKTAALADYKSRKPVITKTETSASSFSESGVKAVETAREILSHIRTSSTRILESAEEEKLSAQKALETVKSDISAVYELFKNSLNNQITSEDIFHSPFSTEIVGKELRCLRSSRFEDTNMTWKENINGVWRDQLVSFTPNGLTIEKYYTVGDTTQKCTISTANSQGLISLTTRINNEIKKVNWVKEKYTGYRAEKETEDGLQETVAHFDEQGNIYEYRSACATSDNVEKSEVYWFDYGEPVTYSSTLRNKAVRGKFSKLEDVRLDGRNADVKHYIYEDPLDSKTLVSIEECRFVCDDCSAVTIKNAN